MSYSNQMIVHAVDTMESYLNNKLPERENMLRLLERYWK